MKRQLLRELLAAVVVAVIAPGVLELAEILLRAGSAGGPLRIVLRGWSSDGAWGWILIGLLAVSLTYPVRACLSLRARDAAGERAGDLGVLAWLGAASAVTFLLAALLHVHAGRVTEPENAAKVGLFHLFRFEREMLTWSTLGAGLVLFAALWGIFGVTWTRHHSRTPSARLAAIVGSVALAFVIGASLLRAWSAGRSFTWNFEWMPPEKRYDVIVGLGAPLVEGRWALIVVAVLTAATILIAAPSEPRSPASSREIKAAAAIFALGLAAFVATRGEAHDALHPLPLWEGSTAGWLDDSASAALPRGERCAPGTLESPIVEIDRSGRTRLDIAAWADVAGLLERLAIIKQLWLEVQPHKRFPGSLGALIPAAAPMDAVAPALEAARAAGFEAVYVIEVLPQRTYATRTLGEIVYQPRVCHVPIPPRVELPRQGTWGDFARSLPAP